MLEAIVTPGQSFGAIAEAALTGTLASPARLTPIHHRIPINPHRRNQQLSKSNIGLWLRNRFHL